MSQTLESYVNDLKWKQPDSWWLSLFLPRTINNTFKGFKTAGFDEHQPFLLGETLVASDGEMIAWCPWDDKCPWLIEPLKRETDRCAVMRSVAALTMQAAKIVQEGGWIPSVLALHPHIESQREPYRFDGQFYDPERCRLLRSLPRCEVTSGQHVLDGIQGPGLFFRWGSKGGGFLLPIVEDN